jgi:cell division protein FtsQ
MPRWRIHNPFRRWHLVVTGTAASLAALAYGGVLLWRSTLLDVAHVEVSGNQRIEAQTLVERANVLGSNIVTADLARIERSIYELPLVAAVRVERDFPNTLRLVIEERQGWGTWEQGGVRYTIDREGVVLGTIPPSPGSPVVRSADTYTLRIGDRVNYQAVDAAAEIYDRLPRQLGTTVSEVAFVRGKGVTVVTTDGQTALLGDSSSISYKLAVWAAMAAEAQKQRISYTSIDLRYGNRPVLQ